MGGQGRSIGGVIPFILDEEIIGITPGQPQPDLGDPSPEALSAMEGYGSAGSWRLEIENIDLRLVSDVELKITYVIPEPDLALLRRVKGLIAAYEQEHSPEPRLDLVTPFSLRQQFPDALSQLGGGPVTLSFQRDNFPSGIADLKLKTVVIQALDSQKKALEGIALNIARPGTALDLVRTTRADGFSEDITTPITFLPEQDRFPVEGSYTLRLTNPSQANQIDEMLLFFMYEFREI